MIKCESYGRKMCVIGAEVGQGSKESTRDKTRERRTNRNRKVKQKRIRKKGARANGRGGGFIGASLQKAQKSTDHTKSRPITPRVMCSMDLPQLTMNYYFHNVYCKTGNLNFK